MTPEDSVDHKARADAKIALEKIKGHEQRCDERMERVEKMFTRIKEGQDKLWESVDHIRAESKVDGFAARDRAVETAMIAGDRRNRALRWVIGIISTALIAVIGWLLLLIGAKS